MCSWLCGVSQNSGLNHYIVQTEYVILCIMIIMIPSVVVSMVCRNEVRRLLPSLSYAKHVSLHRII